MSLQRVPLLLLLLLAAPLSGQEWPSFRGPNGSGIAEDATLPLEWDATTGHNIAWRAEIPGTGISSPIVWDGHVFVTTMDNVLDAESGRGAGHFLLLAFDAESGAPRWQSRAAEEKIRVGRHPEGTHVNATPATDGRHVVAVLGASMLVAYGFQGERLWQQDLGLLDQGMVGSPEIQWGHGSSPILHDGRVYVQVDRHQDSFLAAYDAGTGEELWKAARSDLPSWSTPALYAGETALEVITTAPNYARGYDAATGEELWRFAIGHQVTIPTPLIGPELIYLCGGYPRGQPIHAVRAGARGDISLAKGEKSSHDVAFRTKKGGPYVPTPLLHDNRIYVVNDAGIVAIHDATTGERLDRRRLGAPFTASPVLAGDRLVLASEDGEVYVAPIGDTVEVLATNGMGEPIKATPAIAGRTLYVRTARHLFAVRD